MAVPPLLLPRHDGVTPDPALGGRTTGVARQDAEAFTMNLPQMSAFAVEKYTYYPATAGTGTEQVGYQLVAYGDGPGWGPDYTKFKDNHTKTSFYVDEGNTLGPTEGKYVLYAHGLGLQNLQAVLDFIFGQLAGAIDATNPQA